MSVMDGRESAPELKITSSTEIFNITIEKAGKLIDQLLVKINQSSSSFQLTAAPEVPKILVEAVRMMKAFSRVTCEACADVVRTTFPKVLETFYHFASWLLMSESVRVD